MPASAAFWACVSPPNPSLANLFHSVAYKELESPHRHVLAEGVSWIHLGLLRSSRSNQLRHWVGTDHRMQFWGMNKSMTQFDFLLSPEVSAYRGGEQHIGGGDSVQGILRNPPNFLSAFRQYPLYPCWISAVKKHGKQAPLPHRLHFYYPVCHPYQYILE